MKLSVILPVYNERENIESLIKAIGQEVKDSFEIIVVDDNSPDGTGKIVERIAQNNENVRLLERTKERGLVTAITDGIAKSQGEIILWMDADFSMPPEGIPELVKTLKDCDIAVGSRYIEGGRDERASWVRIFTSRLFNNLAHLILKSSVKDLTSGFIAAKRRVFDKVRLAGHYGEYCISFLYHAQKKGLKIKEIPYTCLPRRRGKPKTTSNLFKFAKYGLIYLLTILKLRREK
ncbi:polyprenol monophosphomannose synthase [bacterium]|nr:polyprenol monophosphomannose synthase [bacterium]